MMNITFAILHLLQVPTLYIHKKKLVLLHIQVVILVCTPKKFCKNRFSKSRKLSIVSAVMSLPSQLGLNVMANGLEVYFRIAYTHGSGLVK